MNPSSGMTRERSLLKKRGFSLVELVIVMIIIVALVAVASAYFSDYLYRAKVAKVRQDLDVIKDAVTLYNAENSPPFRNVNYTADPPVPYGRDYSSNELRNLLGTYLNTLPRDPWGNEYVINTAAGFVASLGEDLTRDSDMARQGRGKDILVYYLPVRLMLARVEVADANGNGMVDAADTLEIWFNKDVNVNTATFNAAGALNSGEGFKYSLERDYPPGIWRALTPANWPPGSFKYADDERRCLVCTLTAAQASEVIIGSWWAPNLNTASTPPDHNTLFDWDPYYTLGPYPLASPVGKKLQAALTNGESPARQVRWKLY